MQKDAAAATDLKGTLPYSAAVYGSGNEPLNGVAAGCCLEADRWIYRRVNGESLS